MPIIIKKESNGKRDSLDLAKNHAKKQISLKINKGIGIFMNNSGVLCFF